MNREKTKSETEMRTYITDDERKRYECVMSALFDLKNMLIQRGQEMMALAVWGMSCEMEKLMTKWVNRANTGSSPEVDSMEQRAKEIMKESFGK